MEDFEIVQKEKLFHSFSLKRPGNYDNLTDVCSSKYGILFH